MSGLAFDNSYAALGEPFSVRQHPTPVREPRLLALNEPLAALLGADPTLLRAQAADWFSGNRSIPGSLPVASAYAGHQFGNFVAQLGDGRAVLLGEVVGADGQRRDIQLKGAGRTRYSRGGDGRAALGPVLREYLVSEAMHALGIPTTRALAAVLTGEPVFRDEVLPGAVITRVASSHIRVGTFECFAAREDLASLQRLVGYVLARHDPELAGAERPALALLEAVCARQAALVAQWMGAGFVHGVMNTDNCSIAGETIDYGPCAFMEAYDPATVFSSIDRHGRYAYANQPPIAQWNLARLAEALLPLIDPDQPRAIDLATAAITAFQAQFAREWQMRLGAKLGLWRLAWPEGAAGSGDAGAGGPRAGGQGGLPAPPVGAAADTDADLMADWLALLQAHRIDWTNAHRALCAAAAGDEAPLRDQFVDREAPAAWLARWRARVGLDAGSCGAVSPDWVRPDAAKPDADGVLSSAADGRGHALAAALRRVNPAYIPRNQAVEAMIAAATQGDLVPFERLQRVLATPFEEQGDCADLARPAPLEAVPYRTFCGT
ncbi:MAG: YdiU family protein [Rhodocyclaceae bacterium]|nr:YdiU family protein [Rhodocyclaceae bacterium]